MVFKQQQTHLQIVQNKIIHYTFDYNKTTNLSRGCFKSLPWLNIANRVQDLAASHVYKCLKGPLPNYLRVFECTRDQREYNTRYSQNSNIWYFWI